jgi:glycosyltransferase involved in cell wall biosynthesis
LILTVITIVRNAEKYIERTITSVLAQTYPNINYIVIDGASTDGTLAIVNRYRHRIATIISEPDSGIADAWNKGLGLAKGQVIGLLNAGDEYAPDAASKAVAALSSGLDLVYGDTDLVADEGGILRHNRGRFSLWFYSGGFGFYHPSCFATRALYERVGGFNTRLRYAMDSDWIARAAMGGARIGHAVVRARMVDGGVSVKNRFLAYGEHLQALHDAGAGPLVLSGSLVMTGLRGLARSAVGAARG